MAQYFQSNFSGGELTPLMYARADLQTYYKSLKTARNIVTIPQGGFRRRFGLEYVDTLSITSFSQVKATSFIYDDNNKFTVYFIPNALLIYKNDSLFTSIATPYGANDIQSLSFDQQLNFLVIANGLYAPYQLTYNPISDTFSFALYVFKNYPVFDFLNNYDSVTFTLGATTGTGISLTASANIFTTENVGGTFEAIPGLAKIVAYVSPTQVTVDIITDFDTTSYTGYQSILTEPAFSNTRGWPKVVSFFQQRIVFGSTESLPNALFFSAINNLQDFLVTFGQATDALLFLIAGTENPIDFLLNAVSLFVFTQGGIYATPLLNDTAFTADTAQINRITDNGAKKDVQPIFADNQIFYLDKSGVNLIALEYNINAGTYQANAKGYTAKTIIRNPVDMDKLEFDPITQGNYLFLCNSDGTLLTYETIDNQNINSWLLQDTYNGEFGHVVNSDLDVYFVIKRRINSQDVFYIEKKNTESFLDCATIQSSNTPFSQVNGLDYLEHETVSVKADGAYLGDNFFIDEGVLQLGAEYTSVEIGYNFIPTITMLPINERTQDGYTLYMQRIIRTVIIDMFETLGIYLNGDSIFEYPIGTYVVGSVPPLYTGFVTIPFGRSLQQNQEVTITQEEPYNMTILAIVQDYEVGG